MVFSLSESSHSTLSVPVQRVFSLLRPETAALLAEHLRSFTDQKRINHYLPEFHHHFPGFLDEMAGGHPPAVLWLLTFFQHSRFLSEELLQHPDWLCQITDLQGIYSTEQYAKRLTEFLKLSSVNVPVQAWHLAAFRRRELLRLVLRDVLGLGTLSEITHELSNLAEAILQRALGGIEELLVQQHGSLVQSENSRKSGSFSVIAVGKLGGQELNYSSDLDLIFLYGQNVAVGGPEVILSREFYRKLAISYTKLLSAYTRAGLCYRVDLRLRPEGKLGEICLPLESAKEYYARRARDWELQMLIKARVVAGNQSVGNALLHSVQPFIYDSNTDFSTIEMMSIQRERLTEKLSSKQLAGTQLDVKLARGGVRDIEFLVQCLQRLHGGSDESLRRRGTIPALVRLLERDLLSITEYARLTNAYQFLRQVEHRLQFDEDRQIYCLPADPDELDRLAHCLPVVRTASEQRPGAELLKQLNQHLENVQAVYGRIMQAQRPLSYHPVAPAATETASETAINEPAQNQNATENAVCLMKSIEAASPAFADALRYQCSRPRIPAIESFWNALRGKPRLFASLNDPKLADYVLQILNTSPYLSSQLIADLSFLEEIQDVAANPYRRAAFESLAAPLNDINALRRFFRREMFRIQIASTCAAEPVFQTLDRTSALAEFMIARAYRIAFERSLDSMSREERQSNPYKAPENEMMLIALGRLGMREFDLGSDADLLFIVPDSEVRKQQFWTRVAENIIEILTEYTGEGSILSIDTRLRPNGREGPLVQTESAYTDYFANYSEAWEGIAYMKARAVAGNLERATAFLAKLQEVDWRRWGQSGRSKQDLKQMRLRLEREQGNDHPLKAGRGSYYDTDFILMYLRLKGAGLFFRSLNTPERIDIVEKMGHLERADAELLRRATTLYRAVDHGLRVYTGRAEAKLPQSADDLQTIAALVDRWTSRDDSDQCFEKLIQMRDSMYQLFHRLFA